MNRRGFLLALAAGTMGGLTACAAGPGRRPGLAPATPAATATLTPANTATVTPISASASSPTPTAASTSPLPSAMISATPTDKPANPYRVSLGSPPGNITSLPGTERNLALTIDDGTDSAVVGAYLDFIEDSGIRLTFFPNGINQSWTTHAARLRPLVESGQVQLGNHTWSHPDITTLSSTELATEVTRNERFLNTTYGVTARPFFRPPYGFHNARTDRVLAGLGYTTITMWYGSFGDSSVLTEAQLMSLARQWLGPERIVIGHANHPTVTRLYGQLLDLIRERQLTTVTLDDAFYGPAGRSRLTF